MTEAATTDRPRRKRRARARRVKTELIGRPPVLTKAVVEAVGTAMALKSATFDTACAMAGVSAREGYRWLEAYRALLDRQDGIEPTVSADAKGRRWTNVNPQLLLAFGHAVERARAVDEDRQVQRIDASATGGAVIYERTEQRTLKDGTVQTTTERRVEPPQWTAAAWLLERKNPDRWGRRVRMEQGPEIPGSPDGSGKPPLTLHEALRQAWAMIEAHKDPRRALTATAAP